MGVLDEIDDICDEVTRLIVESGHDEGDWDAVIEELDRVPEDMRGYFLGTLISDSCEYSKKLSLYYIRLMAKHLGWGVEVDVKDRVNKMAQWMDDL